MYNMSDSYPIDRNICEVIHKYYQSYKDWYIILSCIQLTLCNPLWRKRIHLNSSADYDLESYL